MSDWKSFATWLMASYVSLTKFFLGGFAQVFRHCRHSLFNFAWDHSDTILFCRASMYDWIHGLYWDLTCSVEGGGLKMCRNVVLSQAHMFVLIRNFGYHSLHLLVLWDGQLLIFEMASCFWLNCTHIYLFEKPTAVKYILKSTYYN